MGLQIALLEGTISAIVICALVFTAMQCVSSCLLVEVTISDLQVINVGRMEGCVTLYVSRRTEGPSTFGAHMLGLP